MRGGGEGWGEGRVAGWVKGGRERWGLDLVHTPSIAFRHLPPNSARFGYATEGALDLYLRAAVHRRGQSPPKGLGTNMTVEAA